MLFKPSTKIDDEILYQTSCMYLQVLDLHISASGYTIVSSQKSQGFIIDCKCLISKRDITYKTRQKDF